MATLQLKSVPEELHVRLRNRAKSQHTTMRDYVLGLIEDDLRRPSNREWSDELARRGPLAPGLSGEEVVEAIRRSREERTEQVLGAVRGNREGTGGGGAARGS